MAHERTPSSSVDLVTAKYLEPSFQAEEQVSNGADPNSSASFHTVILPTVRVIPALVVCLILFAIPIVCLSVYAKEKDRRTCGIDWVMWAFGSDETFESVMAEKMEEAQRDMKQVPTGAQLPVTSFDMKQLNLQSFQLNRR